MADAPRIKIASLYDILGEVAGGYVNDFRI
jgi:hypothetical protein